MSIDCRTVHFSWLRQEPNVADLQAGNIALLRAPESSLQRLAINITSPRDEGAPYHSSGEEGRKRSGSSRYRALHQYVRLRILAQLKHMRAHLMEVPFTIKRLGPGVMFPDAEP